ncbi:acetylcholine receptor subunit alpha-type acr-16-like [Convolutriloba macropyga]|uniref:acetylcholine receptor subunit alpha-type acr-16-like n=1 Tax=Convolutriloba macropyga TaxID=536237 RepID=UPI003F523299
MPSETTLFVEFQLHQVLDVDEKNGLWYTKAAFYISYFSDSVVWHPAEYNNISQLKFTQSEKIWTSDLVILNAIDIRYITNPDVYIIYDGFVSLKSSLIAVKLSCGYDVTHFPFDEQTCYFIIGSLFNPLVLYNLVSFSTEAVLKFYIENDQWELLRPVRVYVKRHVTQYEEFYEKFEAEVRLRRRPLYYIIGSQTFPLS